MTGFDIGTRHVGDGAPALIVGEVAQAHEGSYQLAHAYVDAIADAGADAVKFQCHIAAAESWPDEPWRVKPRWGSETRYEYWKRMQFTPEQWRELAEHAKSRGLAFIVSPFSVEAVEMVAPVVDAWKVASGEIGNEPMLRAIGRTETPVIVSTGMTSWVEQAQLIHVWEGLRKVGMARPERLFVGDEPPLWRRHREIAYLQCTSQYPTPPERVGLRQIAELRAFFNRPVGLSDHSGTPYAGLAAVALGADILEVHVKLSDYDPGPDASSSITVAELRWLVHGARFIEAAKRPVDKDRMAEELKDMRALFMGRHERRVAQ